MTENYIFFTNRDEHNFLKNLAPDGYFNYQWLNTQRPFKKWGDGSSVTFKAWGKNVGPSKEGDCVVMGKIHYHTHWRVMSCKRTHPYSCVKTGAAKPIGELF